MKVDVNAVFLIIGMLAGFIFGLIVSHWPF